MNDTLLILGLILVGLVALIWLFCAINNIAKDRWDKTLFYGFLCAVCVFVFIKNLQDYKNHNKGRTYVIENVMDYQIDSTITQDSKTYTIVKTYTITYTK